MNEEIRYIKEEEDKLIFKTVIRLIKYQFSEIEILRIEKEIKKRINNIKRF